MFRANKIYYIVTMLFLFLLIVNGCASKNISECDNISLLNMLTGKFDLVLRLEKKRINRLVSVYGSKVEPGQGFYLSITPPGSYMHEMFGDVTDIWMLTSDEKIYDAQVKCEVTQGEPNALSCVYNFNNPLYMLVFFNISEHELGNYEYRTEVLATEISQNVLCERTNN